MYAVGTGKNRGEQEKEIEWTDAPRGACHCFENAEEMKTCACMHTYHTHASARLHAHAHTQQRNETTHVRYVKHTQVLCLSHSINKYCRNMFLSSQRALRCDRCSLSIFISRPGEAMFGKQNQARMCPRTCKRHVHMPQITPLRTIKDTTPIALYHPEPHHSTAFIILPI